MRAGSKHWTELFQYGILCLIVGKSEQNFIFCLSSEIALTSLSFLYAKSQVQNDISCFVLAIGQNGRKAYTITCMLKQ